MCTSSRQQASAPQRRRRAARRSLQGVLALLLQIVRNVVGSAALTSHDVCWAFSSQSLVLAAEYRTPRIAGRSSWSSHGRKHSGILSAEWSLCRIASTCYADNRTYGDNLRDQEQPATKTLLALSGAKAQRPRIAMGVLVLWAAFGYQLNWRKAQLTSTVNWIGAQITPWTTPSGRARLTVTIPEDKVPKCWRPLRDCGRRGRAWARNSCEPSRDS